MAENCPGCSRDQSCNACLRTFRNQYAHDLLSRGPVADFLAKTLSGLYRKDADGYFPLGLTDARRWFLNQIRRAGRVDLALDGLPELSGSVSPENEWFNVLYEIAKTGSQVGLFFRKDLGKLGGKPEAKMEIHKLALLSELENIQTYALLPGDTSSAALYMESADNRFAAKWSEGQNPFDAIAEIQISVLPDYVESVKSDFNSLEGNAQKLESTDINKYLEGTKVLRIAKGQSISWKDILAEHLPENMEEIHIYDRFIRNRFQFKSLEMLLDFFYGMSSGNGLKIGITTTADTDLRPNVRDQFRRIQQLHQENKPQYVIRDSSEQLPHYRAIRTKSNKGDYTLWLDKGVHIYWFDDLTTYRTVETYIVIEKDM